MSYRMSCLLAFLQRSGWETFGHIWSRQLPGNERQLLKTIISSDIFPGGNLPILGHEDQMLACLGLASQHAEDGLIPRSVRNGLTAKFASPTPEVSAFRNVLLILSAPVNEVYKRNILCLHICGLGHAPSSML